ncbi:OLC1v1023967C2 [Oldenlandia corymbosa var. corymbosa]|nr:OLC1v1023967C2 [Oldenlandia corymbosa var. corymbosa]
MVNSSTSDLSYHDDGNDGEDAMDDDIEDTDYGDDIDDDDECMSDNSGDDDFDYLKMQAQFDNVDLPPGVEASFSWLQPSAVSSSSTTSNVAAQVNVTTSSADGGTSAPVNPHPSKEKFEIASSSSSLANVESRSHEKDESEDEILKKYKAFKAFDIVEDYSDHIYNKNAEVVGQPAKAWTKKVQDEWRILEKDLPDTIFVRAYEARMDLMRAVIVGPQGTPYHDGLFVFDIYFPPKYPEIPPIVHYYSGGLRINPNLYESGKVCLSLLNTWNGEGSEKWLPGNSTMLQVLVSIQALILNATPFYNEPGYERYTGPEGERRCNEYSENVFIMSLKTMMYTLRRPPKHFEDLVAGHFRVHAYDILESCKAYMEGAQVGSLVKGKPLDGKIFKKMTPSPTFKADVAKMVNGLISNFTRYGARDCEKFRCAQ